MTDTSFFTFSAGRVETNRYEAPRVRPAGSIFVIFGSVKAKQCLLPPRKAVYTLQSPYWPSGMGLLSFARAMAAALPDRLVFFSSPRSLLRRVRMVSEAVL